MTSMISNLHARASIIAGLALVGAMAACGGVSVGGHTLIEPVAPPVMAGSVDSPVITERPEFDTVHARAATGPSPEARAAMAATGCFVASGQPFDRRPPSSGPVDPWRAVDHGRPRVLPHEFTPVVTRDEGVVCDAAHDHCLGDCSWLVTTELPPYTSAPYVSEHEATAKGFDNLSEEDAFQAFRSLPVTRKNVAVGALVMVGDGPPHPNDSWILGEVEAIDWDAGTLRLRGLHDDFELAWARVAVLRATRDRLVIVNGFDRERDRLVIDPADLILPR